MPRIVSWISVLTCAAFAGCAGARTQNDLLTARLRQQESEYHRLRTQFDETKADLQLALRERDSLRQQIAQTGTPALPVSAGRSHAPAATLAFQPRLTGGQDDDGRTGDEGLSVMLTPLDADGNTVQAPGKLTLTLRDPALRTADATIGTWEFDADEVAAQWFEGFLGNGYQWNLSWQTPPRHPELELRATLVLPDGRTLDAKHAVTIRLPGEEPADGPGRTPRLGPSVRLDKGDSPVTHDSGFSEPVDGQQVHFRVPSEAATEETPVPAGPSKRPARSSPISVNWTDESMPVRR